MSFMQRFAGQQAGQRSADSMNMLPGLTVLNANQHQAGNVAQEQSPPKGAVPSAQMGPLVLPRRFETASSSSEKLMETGPSSSAPAVDRHDVELELYTEAMSQGSTQERCLALKDATKEELLNMLATKHGSDATSAKREPHRPTQDRCPEDPVLALENMVGKRSTTQRIQGPKKRPSAADCCDEPMMKRPARQVTLGCSRCRGNPSGCMTCRDPSFSGTRFTRKA